MEVYIVRRNLEVAGIAGDFINKIPIRKRGHVVSLIVSNALINGTAKESLAAVFTEEEFNSFLNLPPKAVVEHKQVELEEKTGDSQKENLVSDSNSEAPKFKVKL